ncbi:WXG100 family type VII secretion target [Saccharopolyspora sp. 5N708]|uniref:WXG100 family type VII secretion target n=1 Tax=Saccharopolyspora sp. 5N708 TaxID=3457424 RepID=UPI003FD1D99C
MTDVFRDVNTAAGLTSGAGPVDSARATFTALSNEDWGEFAASAGILALDGLITAIDPIGVALAAGVGWLMEHFFVFRNILDFFAGDPVGIKAGADTWQQVRGDLEKLAGEIPGTVDQHTAEWSGPAGEAYRQRSQELASGVEAMSIAAGTASATIATAGTMVATCRGLIRDIIAAVVAELVKGALAAVAGSVISFGATVAGYLAYAVGRIGMTVGKCTAKIAQLVAKLGKAGSYLAKATDDMAKAMAEVGGKLAGAGGKLGAAGNSITKGGAVLGSTGSALARGGDLGGAAGKVSDAATNLGRRADELADSGTALRGRADDLGQAAKNRTEGAVDNAPPWREPAGSGRVYHAAEQISDVRKPGSIVMRGTLGFEQYHQQNYAADGGRYYEGYNFWGNNTPDSDDGFHDFVDSSVPKADEQFPTT